MGIFKEVYSDDLINRYAGHTFTETIVGSMTKVEFKDTGPVVIAEAQTLEVDDAYRRIREDLVGPTATVLLELTNQQIKNLVNPMPDCLMVYNSTHKVINVALNDKMEDSQTAAAFAAMYEDTPGGWNLSNVSSYVAWTNATPGGSDENDLMVFEDNAGGDRLVVQENGEGVYMVTFSISIASEEVAAVTTAAIHQNGTEAFSIKSSADTPNAGERVVLSASGLIEMVEDDYIDLRISSSVSADLEIFQVSVSANRVERT